MQWSGKSYEMEEAGALQDVIAPGRPIRVVALMEANSVTGPAKNVIEFARRSSRSGSCDGPLDLTLIAFVRGDERRNAFVTAAREAGLMVDVIQERFAFDIGVIPQLRRIVAERHPDIIQTHAVKSHFLVWLLRLHRRCRWIAFNRGYTWENLKVRSYNQLDRLSLPAADRVVTVCEAFAQELRRKGIGSEKIVVRHNMVAPFVRSTPAQIADLQRHWGISTDALVLLAVGRLSPEKGHADLIEAISRLRPMRLRRSFRLIIAGDGSERNAIARKIEAMGVGDLVTLVGHQGDMRPYYSMAEILVLPSHSEGSPNVLLEAMAAGVSTVATNVGGVTEIVKNGETSLVVGPGRPQELAQALARMIDDEPLRRRIANAALESVAQYDPEHYCEFLIDVHRRLVHPLSVGRDE